MVSGQQISKCHSAVLYLDLSCRTGVCAMDLTSIQYIQNIQNILHYHSPPLIDGLKITQWQECRLNVLLGVSGIPRLKLGGFKLIL